LLYDEYRFEFAFEGTRYYDMMRLARHKNETGLFGGNFGSEWMAKKLAYRNLSKDMTNTNNWYLPFK